MIFFVSPSQRLDLFEVPLGRFAAQADEPAGVAAIKPAIITDIRAEHNIGQPAGRLGQAHLRAMDAAHDDFEEVSAREIIELLVDGENFAEELAHRLFLGARQLSR